ncbi:MAG TPA: DUF1343 domain-containing protein [Flavobacterium sp.]|nr:DUF1343 domain-containing protein [Flavobacterium sp.]
MISNSIFKNTVLFLVLSILSCGNSFDAKGKRGKPKVLEADSKSMTAEIRTGADNWIAYLSILKKHKNIGIVANQSSIVNFNPKHKSRDEHHSVPATNSMHLVDWLVENKLNVIKIYAPEHGFRGTADAGELIKDGKDTKTGIPIISLYGDNKKPKPEQLAGIDILLFDLQDVGARFYTYISSLHYIMEACAENNIQLIILDRPNPNGSIADGPILEKENSSFIGMHPVPVLHGMTIGEYGKMINGEKWLKNGIQCKLTVIPCLNYTKDMAYSLPVKPSPNLPNDQAVNLYASLCFFEGTNVSVGRGTEKQFQVYGSPFLPKTDFSFIPKPNLGAKDPLHNGKACYGEDLSKTPRVHGIELKWLIKAYSATADKSKFFIPFFKKLAGTDKLQKQIESGLSEAEIRKSWQPGLENFKKIRKLYQIY